MTTTTTWSAEGSQATWRSWRMVWGV